MGRFQEMTPVIGIGVIHSLLRGAEQSVTAYPDPDDLESEACAGAKNHDIARDPTIARVERKKEGDDCRWKEQKRHFNGCLRTREGAQVRKI